MRVRALRAIIVKVSEGVSVLFEFGEVKDLDPLDAALALANAGWDKDMKGFPLKLEGKAPLCPGTLVTWGKDDHFGGPATIVGSYNVGEENWLAVMYWDRKEAQLLKAKEVIDSNPIQLFSAMFCVLQDETDEERKTAAKAILIELLSSIREDDGLSSV